MPETFNPFGDAENYFSPANMPAQVEAKETCASKAALILAYYGQRSDIPLSSEYWDLANRISANKSCSDISINLQTPELKRTEAETVLSQANAILNAENGKMSNIAYRDVYWALMNRYRALIRTS